MKLFTDLIKQIGRATRELPNRAQIIVYFTISLLTIIMGCSGNSRNETEKSQTDSIRPAVQSTAHYIYVTQKEKDGIVDRTPDSTFYMDSNKITVSVYLVGQGNYAYIDTICGDNDSCTVYAYKNHFIHITIKSSEEKTVIIDRDFIAKSAKGMDLSKCVLGSTWIDSIAVGEKRVLFTTPLIGNLPESSLYALCSVDLNGELKFIKIYEDDDAGE